MTSRRSCRPSATAARRGRAGIIVLAAVTTAIAVWQLRPRALAATGPDADIVACCAWAAWIAAGYLCLAVAASAVGALRSQRWLSRVAPPVVRHLVESAISVGLVATLVGPAVANAAPLRDPVQVTSPEQPAAPALDWPGLSFLAPSPPDPPPSERHAAAVRVRPGDTLWSIAAHSLGATASPDQVAASWPRWYAANRQLIGPDPSLIHPGEHLVPPDTSRRAP